MLKLVRTVFQDGERYPLLVTNQGIPLWYPTLYVTSQLRNASKAPNTITANLAVIRQLLTWCHEEGINLEKRFMLREFLSSQEIESMCRFLKTKNLTSIPKRDVISLARHKEQVRVKNKRSSKVSSSTQYIRLTYVSDYLNWLAYRVVESSNRHLDANVVAQIKKMMTTIRVRRPKKRGEVNSRRKGLATPYREKLLALVKPDCENNPFSQELKVRNELIINLLYELGLRQGELLAIRIRDIDLSQNQIVIPRRHDDPDDPRANQPVAKTLDRRLPVKTSLVELISNYIIQDRRHIKQARTHDFLLVVHKVGPYLGQPLSSRGLSKIFSQIQAAEPEAFGNLTPHLLRHTWNDRFSELSDQAGTSEAREEKMRSYAMGWKEGSGTSATYTRRHIEKAAQKAALQLQEKLGGKR